MLSTKPIFLVGEQMIDRYLEGAVERMSPEAPIPIVKITRQFDITGGAGNVQQNLLTLGADVCFNYQRDPGLGPIKNRLMAQGQMLARWDVESQLTAEPIKAWPDCAALVISDYAKGMFNIKFIDLLASLCPLTTPVFVDTKQSPNLYEAFHSHNVFFFPNQHEYDKATSQYNLWRRVILKQGAGGMQILEFGLPIARQPAVAASDVQSVVGAGDTVLAAFAIAYLQQKLLPECLLFAAKAATIAIQKPYTATASLWEVEHFND